MKSLLPYTLFALLVCTMTADLFAQTVPQGFNFQAVARNADGEIISNSPLGVQITIIKGSESGDAVYTETQTVETDPAGSFQLVIGEGTSENSFAGIPWASDNFFIKLAIDPSGSTDYEELGVTRLLSVPYAQVARNVIDGISVGEEPITRYHLNSSMGDTSFTVNASGSEGLAGIISTASTDGRNDGVRGLAISSNGNTESQFGLYGRADGLGSGSHFGVYGLATGGEGSSSSRYGMLGLGQSYGRYNFGVQGVAQGPGDGTVVPLGEGPTADNFGSFNIGGGFYGAGNINGNIGVEGVAQGNMGERVNFGVLGSARATANAPNVGIRAEAFNSPVSNIAIEADASGGTNNLGLRVSAHNGHSNIGMQVYADTAAILNGHTIFNGDLTINGTIHSGEISTGSPSGSFEEFSIKKDNATGIQASINNDPNGGDPNGWSGNLNLWGTNSPNIQMRGADWENSDLPVIQLFGNRPTGEGWFNEHLNLRVNQDAEQQWGHLSLQANDGVSNVDIGAKHWEDGVNGAGRPFLRMSGNTPDQQQIWLEVSENSGAEYGNLQLTSTDGSELGISAYGLTNWNGVNIDGGLNVIGHTILDGDLTINGTIHSGDIGSGSPTGSFEELNVQIDGASGIQAGINNDPNDGNPTGWSGYLNLWGKNSPNIQMGGSDWENNDLPVIQLFGNRPTGDGWFNEHVNLRVNQDAEQQWGHLSILANDGISNVDIGAKHWEDGVDGAGRPFLRMSGNTPDQQQIWLEVSENSGTEFGNLHLTSTDGAELGINAYGLYNWNNGVNVDGGLNVNGDITHTGDIQQTSDRNLKENILPLENALGKIMQLTPKTYNFRGNGYYNGLKLSTGMHYGLIAQEVENVLPALVKNNTHTYSVPVSAGHGPNSLQETSVQQSMDYKTMNYTELVPVLIKAMQEQQEEIENLKRELLELKESR